MTLCMAIGGGVIMRGPSLRTWNDLAAGWTSGCPLVVIVGYQMSGIEAGTAAGLGLRILLAARPGERKEERLCIQVAGRLQRGAAG